jgi:hypothetical protein
MKIINAWIDKMALTVASTPKGKSNLKIVYHINWPHTQIFIIIWVIQLACFYLAPKIHYGHWLFKDPHAYLHGGNLINEIPWKEVFTPLLLTFMNAIFYFTMYIQFKYNITLGIGGLRYNDDYLINNFRIHFSDMLMPGVGLFLSAIVIPSIWPCMIFGLIDAQY